MDEQGLRQAFLEHKNSIYAFAYRMTNSAAAADDLTQDCFLELFRRPERFDAARGPLRNFLFGVTRNLALKRWRSENRFRSLEAEPSRRKAKEPTVDAALAVGVAMQALSPVQREAIILFEFEGLTLEEIADVTQTEVGTVKSRLHRARESLRVSLAPLRPCHRGH